MTLPKAILKYTLRIVLIFLGGILFYLLIAFVFSRISLSGREDANKDIAIYILTNGVHSDLVVPIQSDVYDWSQQVSAKYTRSQRTDFTYLALGWGDKGFYLETPEWKDLKPSVAFKAVTGLNSTAMHATFYTKLTEGEDCIKIWLSKDQYRNLVRYITHRFRKDENDRFILIPTDAVYGDDDVFYEAKGRYHLFYTCNTWTNEGLRVCGQKNCLWTPFDKAIFKLYKK